jgi:large subunit ribosomal protein L35
MPKMKTHSGAKKRFSLTASGKVKAAQAGKQHGMRRRTKSPLRDQRGTEILCDQDAKRIKKVFLPNS